jgi:hypothetical protein
VGEPHRSHDRRSLARLAVSAGAIDQCASVAFLWSLNYPERSTYKATTLTYPLRGVNHRSGPTAAGARDCITSGCITSGYRTRARHARDRRPLSPPRNAAHVRAAARRATEPTGKAGLPGRTPQRWDSPREDDGAARTRPCTEGGRSRRVRRRRVRAKQSVLRESARTARSDALHGVRWAAAGFGHSGRPSFFIEAHGKPVRGRGSFCAEG